MKKQLQAVQFLLYKSENGKIKVDVLVQNETVWLTQEQMAELFGKSRSTINEHIKNVYEEKELEELNTMEKFGNSEFAKKPTNFYNLDVIISVGYRVKSLQGTRFRQWATSHLKEFIIKGFTMDDVVMTKNKQVMMKDWVSKLNTFLQFNEKEILEHKGKISHEVAVSLALGEYEKYKVIQDRHYVSDFDTLLLELNNNKEDR